MRIPVPFALANLTRTLAAATTVAVTAAGVLAPSAAHATPAPAPGHGGVVSAAGEGNHVVVVARSYLGQVHTLAGMRQLLTERYVTSQPALVRRYAHLSVPHAGRFTVTWLSDQACVSGDDGGRLRVTAGACTVAEERTSSTPLTDSATVAAVTFRHALAQPAAGFGRRAARRDLFTVATLADRVRATVASDLRVAGVADADGDGLDDDARVTLTATDGRAVCAWLPVRPTDPIALTYRSCAVAPARPIAWETWAEPTWAQTVDAAVTGAAGAARATQAGYPGQVTTFLAQVGHRVAAASPGVVQVVRDEGWSLEISTGTHTACVVLPAPGAPFTFTRAATEARGTWHPNACRV